MLNFSGSGHAVDQVHPVLLERGDLKSKEKVKLSEHFCGDDKTAEVVLRMSISVNRSVSTEQ